MRLERNISKPADRYRLGWLSRTASVSDIISTTSQSIFLATQSVILLGLSCLFPANRLVLSARLSTHCTSLAPSIFSPALASPAAPLPHPTPPPFCSLLFSLIFSFSSFRFDAPSQHGAAGRYCGVVPTRRTGALPVGPPTPTYPTASLQTTHVLESRLNILI